MNWLKVGAVVIGGVVVFFVVGSVIHAILALLSTIAFVAIVGGGIYAASKIIGSRRREPELRQRPEYDSEPQPRYQPPARSVSSDVDDELARLRREMGR